MNFAIPESFKKGRTKTVLESITRLSEHWKSGKGCEMTTCTLSRADYAALLDKANDACKKQGKQPPTVLYYSGIKLERQ